MTLDLSESLTLVKAQLTAWSYAYTDIASFVVAKHYGISD